MHEPDGRCLQRKGDPSSELVCGGHRERHLARRATNELPVVFDLCRFDQANQ
jgi:hypothetical protein